MIRGKDETNFVKGVAITAMVFHHLFGFPARLDVADVFVEAHGTTPVLQWIAGFARFCVPTFLFLSGFGFASGGKFGVRYAFGKAWRFLGTFWWYFLVMVPFGVVFGGESIAGCRIQNFDVAPIRMLQNILLLRVDFNYEWWFVRPYLILVCALPLLGRIRLGRISLLAWSGATYLVGYLGFKLPFPGLELLFQTMSCQFPFMLGMVAARESALTARLRDASPWTGAALLGGCVTIFAVLKMPSLSFTVPFLVLAFLVLKDSLPALAVRTTGYLGRYAMPIWLTHSFLCYYYFENRVYSFRSWATVFVVMMSASVLMAVLLERSRLAVVGRIFWIATAIRVHRARAM